MYFCSNLKLSIDHWSQTQFLEGHSSAQFSSNPNQTHLIQLIKVFRITRNFQAGVIWSWLDQNCAELWPSRNWVWDHCYRYIHHVCKENISWFSVHFCEALLLKTEAACASCLFSLFDKSTTFCWYCECTQIKIDPLQFRMMYYAYIYEQKWQRILFPLMSWSVLQLHLSAQTIGYVPNSAHLSRLNV